MPQHHPLRALLAKKQLNVVGLMSGTSLDGLDIALCRMGLSQKLKPRLLHAKTVGIPDDIKHQLRAIPDISHPDAARLDMNLGQWYAHAVCDVVKPLNVPIDLIGTHGQTVFHEHNVTTSQIGEPSYLASQFDCPVVSDFRRADMAAGGCGAPLVPAFERDMFDRDTFGIAALNIGGIANVTLLPDKGSRRPPIAFDTGPGNMIVDGLARHYSHGQLSIDLDGQFAARGLVDQGLLEELTAHRFFSLPPPRSAGREDFGEAYLEALLALTAPRDDQDWYNLFATAVALTVQTISQAIAEWRNDYPTQEVFVSGGGVHNPLIMKGLADAMPFCRVSSSAEAGIDPDFKEAMAFAYLATLCVANKPGNVPSVTGANKAVTLGRITLP